MNATTATFSSNIFHFNSTQNVHIFIDDSTIFSNNTLNVPQSPSISVNNEGAFSNNTITAINASSFLVYCTDTYSKCDGIWNVYNASSVWLDLDHDEGAERAGDTDTPFIGMTTINASNATNVHIDIGTHSKLQFLSLFATNASITMHIEGTLRNSGIFGENTKSLDMVCDAPSCGIINNSITVSNARSVTVQLSDDKARFEENSLFAEQITKMLAVIIEENTNFISNELHLDNAMSVHIENKGNYAANMVTASNIKSDFTLQCIGAFDVCTGVGDVLDLQNAEKVMLIINPNIPRNITLEVDLNVMNTKRSAVHIGSEVVMNTLLSVLNSTANAFDFGSSENVDIRVEGVLMDSVINGHDVGGNLSITCDHPHGACRNLTIFTSDIGSEIYCVDHGCHSLNIFTRRDINDITMKSVSCECEEYLSGDCVERWDIHCDLDNEGRYVMDSVFDGSNCTGMCCGDIMEMMHETECPWPSDDGDQGSATKSSNGAVVIAAVVTGLGCLVVMGMCLTRLVYRAKKEEKEEKIVQENRMEFVSVSDLTDDRTPSTSSQMMMAQPLQSL